jgi:N-acetylglucosaminyldiphosphoundecaprenol N-acetyl-beta-D-mannosaminyltransferase
MIPAAHAPTIDELLPNRRRSLLGVRVDDVSWREALDAIDTMIASFSAMGRRHMVITPNPEIVIQAREDEALCALIGAADLVLCDGVGLRWAGARLGQPLRAVIPGSELTRRLAARHGEIGGRWFLLGAREGVAERAAVVLAEANAGLVIVGTHAGEPGPGSDEEARALINAAGPIDVLLVAYGTPAQEMWIARNLPYLDVAVAIGVGGTFDFLAGEAPWPPKWAERLGLIWLWRLVREPSRWRRQVRLLRFVGLVVGAWVGVGLWRRGGGGGDVNAGEQSR